ncbi:F-box/kelch-repeat protein At3g06240-like [Papaver somniferum]|uniref:F-box/kelch-repeat protein At3g06240-like n=1 Tax=Papaver somniferum TaxID=3469 RepID=UPI000E7023E0|nr:F-box/kelch-repeat protein At3g06240-like [Papaver somniferum]
MDKNKILPSLPEEIIIDILSRLPPISLLKFRCVCKSWSILFNDPKLINLIMKNNIVMLRDDNTIYSFDYESSSSLLPDDIASHIKKIHLPPVVRAHPRIVGSCKGLVCLTSSRSYCLWNPSTREYKAIPISTAPGYQSVSSGCSTRDITHGFGYDCLTDDYKFIEILPGTNSSRPVVGVYSLRSNSWEPGYIPYEFSRETPPGVLSNGALHWFANSSSSSSRVLIAMDVGDQSTREIAQPGKFDVNGGNRHLDVLDRCLCMLYSSDDSSESFEVWVMKDYGVRESWMQVYNIPRMTMFGRTLRCFRQIQCLRNGELLCEIKTQNDDKADDSTMVLYNPKDDKVRILKINGDRSYFTSSIFQIESYVQSSVSLNSGTYVDQEQEKKDLSVAFKKAIWK